MIRPNENPASRGGQRGLIVPSPGEKSELVERHTFDGDQFRSRALNVIYRGLPRLAGVSRVTDALGRFPNRPPIGPIHAQC
jgi:hypothetical protein